jgi:hypothetical protein
MSFLDTVTVLRRNSKSNTYHRAGCGLAPRTVPWIWAEGKTRAEVADTERNGLHPCKACKPLDALPDADDS